jgi:alpha-glucosidase
MRFHMARLNVHSLQTAMNEISNHDHSRFLTRTNGKTGRLHTVGPRMAEQGVNVNTMMEAVVFQMTWPGAPTVYYGDEAGMMGWTDPDNRRPFPWGGEDARLMTLHREMIGLRQKYPVLRGGSTDFIWNDYGFISFGRWDSRERMVIIINNNPAPKEVLLPVWKIGCAMGTLTRVAAAFDGSYQKGKMTYPISDGCIRLTVPGQSALVLAYDGMRGG